MSHEWSEGADHGLAWTGAIALVEGALAQDAATRVWHHPQASTGVRGFVTALQEVSGLDWWSLPNFAAAFAVAQGWRVVVRGPWVARWPGGELSGASVSTWAEALVPSDAGPVELGEASEMLARPLVAGVVPACRLRTGVSDAPAGLPAREASADPAPVAPAASEPELTRGPAVVEPEDREPPAAKATPWWASAVAAQAEPAPVESIAERGADDGATLLPEDEFGLDAAVLDAAPQAPEATAGPDEQGDEVLAPAGDGEAAAGVEGVAAPAGGVVQGRFARQYGDTMVASVEDAAVREDAGMIDSVPGSPDPVAALATDEDAVGTPGTGFAGDHDGATVLASSTPLPAPPPQAEVAPVDERAETSEGVPLVLAALCGHGHPNPPERSTCTVCGAAVASETARVPRPSLGTLLFSDGRRIDLTAPVIVGRSPRAERFTGSLAPQLVPVSNSHISGMHLQIDLEGWRVQAVDLRSTNGTYLRRAGEAPARLSERSEALQPGDVLDLGHGVTITVETLR